MANGHGGKREGAGRKPVRLLLEDDLKQHDKKAIDKLIEGVNRGEFQYIKLFMEYRWGKPKQIIDHKANSESFNIPIGEWLK